MAVRRDGSGKGRACPVNHPAAKGLLTAFRLAGAGVMLLAAFFKLKGGPFLFSQSIESFEIMPTWGIPFVAHFLPWFEMILGLALLFGVWTRQSAALATATLTVFTIGLASVIARGLNVNCGCFGGLFGEAKVTESSVVRNIVFIAMTATVWYLGGGYFQAAPGDSDQSDRTGAAIP